jgi:hypothetical protein
MSTDLILLAAAGVALYLYHQNTQAKPAANAGTVGTPTKAPEVSPAGSEQVYTDTVKASRLGKILEQLSAQVAALPGAGT